jgi:hypothetical protein
MVCKDRNPGPEGAPQDCKIGRSGDCRAANGILCTDTDPVSVIIHTTTLELCTANLRFLI